MRPLDLNLDKPARRANRGTLLRIAAAIFFIACPAAARAQDVQHRLPAFQAPASDSLESEMMTRLSVTGELEPGDLARLARLNVLNSISMLVNVRADLPSSTTGNQLEQEMTSLWNSSEAFYEVVSSAPLDKTSLAEAQYWLDSVTASQRQLSTSLGGFPGLSTRAKAIFSRFPACSCRSERR